MDNETPPLGTEFESRQNKCWAGFKQKLFSCFERLDSYLFGVPMKPEDASGNYDINVMMVAMEVNKSWASNLQAASVPSTLPVIFWSSFRLLLSCKLLC